MKQVREARGSVASIVTITLLIVFLLGAIGFGGWAFMSRQDYKQHTDAKIKVAVNENTKKVQLQDAKDYAEAAKKPLKLYSGPEAYGSVRIQYPKTWSVYVVSNTGQPLDAYFSPDFVPAINDQTAVFALRVQIVPVSYSQTLMQFDGLQKQGKVKVAPFSLAKTPNAAGVRIDGQLTQSKQGSMVVLPVRDKTLKMWVESTQYMPDFNTLILPNASFAP